MLTPALDALNGSYTWVRLKENAFRLKMKDADALKKTEQSRLPNHPSCQECGAKIVVSIKVPNGRQWHCNQCAHDWPDPEDVRLRNPDRQESSEPPQYLEGFGVELASDTECIEAANLLQQRLTGWVDEWLRVRKRSSKKLVSGEIANYLGQHPDMMEILEQLHAPRHIMQILLGLKAFPFQLDFTVANDPVLTAKAEALRLFITLLRSNIPVGRCTLPRCQRYYLNVSNQRKKHCCSNAHSAALILEARRAKERTEKIRRTAAAIDKWPKTRTSKDWKQWVARHARVTLNFITSALNKGEVKPPQLRHGPTRRIARERR